MLVDFFDGSADGRSSRGPDPCPKDADKHVAPFQDLLVDYRLRPITEIRARVRLPAYWHQDNLPFLSVQIVPPPDDIAGSFPFGRDVARGRDHDFHDAGLIHT